MDLQNRKKKVLRKLYKLDLLIYGDKEMKTNNNIHGGIIDFRWEKEIWDGE